MALTREEVQHIAELARLSLSEEEIVLYAEQLSSILEYAAKLNKIDTGDIPPTASVLPLDTVLRKDERRPCLDRDELVKRSAASEDGMFRVDAVIGDGDA